MRPFYNKWKNGLQSLWFKRNSMLQDMLVEYNNQFGVNLYLWQQHTTL